jgi:hypothetical protein
MTSSLGKSGILGVRHQLVMHRLEAGGVLAEVTEFGGSEAFDEQGADINQVVVLGHKLSLIRSETGRLYTQRISKFP